MSTLCWHKSSVEGLQPRLFTHFCCSVLLTKLSDIFHRIPESTQRHAPTPKWDSSLCLMNRDVVTFAYHIPFSVLTLFYIAILIYIYTYMFYTLLSLLPLEKKTLIEHLCLWIASTVLVSSVNKCAYFSIIHSKFTIHTFKYIHQLCRLIQTNTNLFFFQNRVASDLDVWTTNISQ